MHGMLSCAVVLAVVAVSGGEDWNQLNALIERNRGNPDAYAVFDFDYKMLVEFNDLQLALLFLRNWREPALHELASRGGRVVVQGRDEARGCFIPEPRCRELR